MNTATIIANISQHVQLDKTETEFFGSILIPRPFRQGELLIKAGDVARYMLYMNEGYVMTYYTAGDGNDYVVQFAASGWWCGDNHSISTLTDTTPYSTRALCDGEALLLPKLAHQHLLDNYPKFERYFRIIFQNLAIRYQQRIMESHSATAEERYTNFRNTYPNIEQYVQQKYIASFLGITPEFLSKVRRQLSRGNLNHG